jgi:AcrR family transcriptional regulator
MELILDVAEEVIAEVGYDAATTNLIAVRAQMSPGSLYQYFANKAAIVEALADRYVVHLAEARDGLFAEDLTGLPLAQLVDRVVDPIVAFNVAHPAAKSLLAAVDVAPELATAGSRLHAAIGGRVGALIAGLAPERRADERQISATVSLQILAGVLPAVVAASPRDRPKLIRELKSALGGYWGALARPAGGSGAVEVP